MSFSKIAGTSTGKAFSDAADISIEEVESDMLKSISEVMHGSGECVLREDSGEGAYEPETPAVAWPDPITELGEGERWFSELFFPPADIGKPDVPVRTWFHKHDEWRRDEPWIAEHLYEEDPHYIWPKEITYAFAVAMLDARAVAKVGPPGTGKTTFCEQWGAVTGKPVYIRSNFESQDTYDYLYKEDLRDGETVTTILPYLKSFKFPFLTVSDEHQRAPRGQQLLYNHVINEDGHMSLPNQIIKPDPDWKFVTTDNTYGWGDGADEFQSFVCDMSTKTRFAMTLTYTRMESQSQVDLLMDRVPGLPEQVANQIINFGERVSAAYDRGELPMAWQARTAKAAGQQAIRFRNPVTALKYSYIEFLAEDAERQLCYQFFNELGMLDEWGEG
jgi:MoxR-like ATPase